MWTKLFAVVCVVGTVSLLTVVYIVVGETQDLDHGEVDRWAATEYTIACIEAWNAGRGIQTHSTYSPAPRCELPDEDGVYYPLDYTINYVCDGNYNLTFTFKGGSWGMEFPGCRGSTRTAISLEVSD